MSAHTISIAQFQLAAQLGCYLQADGTITASKDTKLPCSKVTQRIHETAERLLEKLRSPETKDDEKAQYYDTYRRLQKAATQFDTKLTTQCGLIDRLLDTLSYWLSLLRLCSYSPLRPNLEKLDLDLREVGLLLPQQPLKETESRNLRGCITTSDNEKEVLITSLTDEELEKAFCCLLVRIRDTDTREERLLLYPHCLQLFEKLPLVRRQGLITSPEYFKALATLTGESLVAKQLDWKWWIQAMGEEKVCHYLLAHITDTDNLEERLQLYPHCLQLFEKLPLPRRRELTTFPQYCKALATLIGESLVAKQLDWEWWIHTMGKEKVCRHLLAYIKDTDNLEKRLLLYPHCLQLFKESPLVRKQELITSPQYFKVLATLTGAGLVTKQLDWEWWIHTMGKEKVCHYLLGYITDTDNLEERLQLYPELLHLFEELLPACKERLAASQQCLEGLAMCIGESLLAKQLEWNQWIDVLVKEEPAFCRALAYTLNNSDISYIGQMKSCSEPTRGLLLHPPSDWIPPLSKADIEEAHFPLTEAEASPAPLNST